jgi:hypothetical protein
MKYGGDLVPILRDLFQGHPKTSPVRELLFKNAVLWFRHAIYGDWSATLVWHGGGCFSRSNEKLIRMLKGYKRESSKCERDHGELQTPPF